VKFKPAKLAPILIAVSVILVVCMLHLLQLDFFERLERMTYDFRVRQALKFSPPISTNLGFVEIDDASIAFVQTNQVLGYRYGLYWPRQVYGRLTRELSSQGAKAIAFDVIFGEVRPDHPPVQMADGRLMESDEFFALQIQRAGNVILADAKGIIPPDLFVTNSLRLGDISTDKDVDGVLRRAQAFHVRKKWHPLFLQVQADPELGVDLRRAVIKTNCIVLVRSGAEPIEIPIDSEGRFELADFVGDNLPPGVAPNAMVFTEDRVWNMGIALAAQDLGIDLDNAKVDLHGGKITFRGRNGIERVLPVDNHGVFYIDWSIRYTDPRLFKDPIQKLLLQERQRLDKGDLRANPWSGKLVVVGSSAIGNDLTDRGATPLERDTLLAGAHWNVANSLLMGRFVQQSSAAVDIGIIVVLASLSAFFTWRMRILVATVLVVMMIVAYSGFALAVYVQNRHWLPMVMPVGGALVMTYICLITWRGVFEQAEQRRVKSIFSRIVSPNIVHELLGAEKLSLGGARREVTVLFADVRGFTEFTDMNHERAEAYVAEHPLTDAEKEAYFDQQARETLATVNTYLALVADIVKKHAGTLDKYIGDCVMAFWGAPTPNTAHARDCVLAAIEAQRSLAELNEKRTEENKRLEIENLGRVSAGLPEKTLLPVLSLGSGINTGLVTVGLMGSEAHISNYTVFGREVNLASRLESLSGRGRILISGPTYERLLTDDPELAATCVALPPEKVKGIRLAVKIYEVPWRGPDSAGPANAASPDTARITADTSLISAKNEAGHP
jgi:class 3 adenylate cyclase/CHASE2 domain-containing sensor protein